jgi:glycosyltransferase involved in cell wall biosynthesis
VGARVGGHTWAPSSVRPRVCESGRLKILGIADAGYVHTHKWANYFAAAGHDVSVVPFQPMRAERPSDLHPSVRILQPALPNLHLKRFWITAAAVRRMRTLLRDLRPDLVHAHFLGSGAWFGALAVAHPLVVTVMGGDIVGGRWNPGSRREGLLSAFTLRRADAVTCWSRRLLDVVRPRLRPGVPTAVISGGVDTRIFRPLPNRVEVRRGLGIDPDAFVLLSPRLFWPLYNIHVIVEAFAAVRARMPTAVLALLLHRADHYPEYRQRVETAVDRLGLRSSIRFLPPVPNGRMPEYYAAADATVSVPRTDGTPMTVLESMACGTPAIVSDLAEYDDALFRTDENVLRVPVEDARALAAAALRLAEEPSTRERLAAAGRETTRQHADYATEMGRLAALYDEVLR